MGVRTYIEYKLLRAMIPALLIPVLSACGGADDVSSVLNKKTQPEPEVQVVGPEIVVENWTPAPSVMEIDPELGSYVDRFGEDMARRGISPSPPPLLRIVWAEEMPKTEIATPLGVCAAYNAGSAHEWREILVRSKASWGKGLSAAWNEAELRTIMYHELGHCVLGLEHEPPKAMNASWFRIMELYPHLAVFGIRQQGGKVTEYVDEKIWTKSVDELFDEYLLRGGTSSFVVVQVNSAEKEGGGP